MSTHLPENNDTLVEAREQEVEGKEKKRKHWLLLLLLLLVLLGFVATLFVRYLLRPAPLPELVSVRVHNPPHYLFSIYGVDRPGGVAISPQGDRIYVAETGGERLIKMFNRDGEPLGSFAPPRTRPGERAPVYLATDSNGRVYVTDRLQHGVFVYDRDGTYLDTILGPELTLSEYVATYVADLQPGATFAYNAFEADVYYQTVGGAEQTLPTPSPTGWSPLGVRVDGTGRMLLTEVAGDRHAVREIPGSVILSDSWQDFDPSESTFGTYGQDDGQLLFPNAAVIDSQGRVHVSDGNNGRISVWDGQGSFLFHFGLGAGDSAFSLPRGAAIDARDRLHVVDALGQHVKVYDVSGLEPNFLFVFGDWGLGDGQFNYPNDIALDTTGRLYVVDRENFRIQIWSY